MRASGLRRALDALYAVCGWLAAGFIVAIAAVVMAQVALNAAEKIAAALGLPRLGMTIPSYADFTGFFLAAASFLALAATLRGGGHIRVTLFTGRLRGAAARAVEGGALAVALAVTSWFCWFCGRLAIESWTFGDLSPGIVAVPLWIPQSSLVVGLAALAVALADDLARVLRGEDPSYAGKGEGMLADPDHLRGGE